MSQSVTNASLFLLDLLKSLFNLLEFQRLVLNYSPPARVHDLPRNQKVELPTFLCTFRMEGSE